MHTEHADGAELNGLSGEVIGCAFAVLNTLGAGFLEKVYENALAHEPRKAGFAVAQQHGITVVYDGSAPSVIARSGATKQSRSKGRTMVRLRHLTGIASSLRSSQ